MRVRPNSAIRFLRFHSLPLLAVALMALIPFAIVSGQALDDKVEIVRQTQGNYSIVVEVLPIVPVMGPVNFTVTPTSAETGVPVQNARITLVAHDPEGFPAYQARALNTPAATDQYIGNISFESTGDWQIHIELATEEFGEEVFVAPLTVGPVAVGTNPAGGIVMALVLVAFVLGAVYLWLSSRRALARRDRLQTTT